MLKKGTFQLSILSAKKVDARQSKRCTVHVCNPEIIEKFMNQEVTIKIVCIDWIVLTLLLHSSRTI